KVLARCCRIGAVQTFWRFGVLVQGALSGGEGTGSFALVLEYSSQSNQLDMKVYGDICTVAPWAALAYAISTVKVMAMEFPGLRSRAFVACPQHGEDMLITSTFRHLPFSRFPRSSAAPTEYDTAQAARSEGDKLLEASGCSGCSS
ncbi:unnamed protein product, partial [Laminaria digitata]